MPEIMPAYRAFRALTEAGISANSAYDILVSATRHGTEKVTLFPSGNNVHVCRVGGSNRYYHEATFTVEIINAVQPPEVHETPIIYI